VANELFWPLGVPSPVEVGIRDCRGFSPGIPFPRVLQIAKEAVSGMACLVLSVRHLAQESL